MVKKLNPHLSPGVFSLSLQMEHCVEGYISHINIQDAVFEYLSYTVLVRSRLGFPATDSQGRAEVSVLLHYPTQGNEQSD